MAADPQQLEYIRYLEAQRLEEARKRHAGIKAAADVRSQNAAAADFQTNRQQKLNAQLAAGNAARAAEKAAANAAARQKQTEENQAAYSKMATDNTYYPKLLPEEARPFFTNERRTRHATIVQSADAQSQANGMGLIGLQRGEFKTKPVEEAIAAAEQNKREEKKKADKAVRNAYWAEQVKAGRKYLADEVAKLNDSIKITAMGLAETVPSDNTEDTDGLKNKFIDELEKRKDNPYNSLTLFGRKSLTPTQLAVYDFVKNKVGATTLRDGKVWLQRVVIPVLQKAFPQGGGLPRIERFVHTGKDSKGNDVIPGLFPLPAQAGGRRNRKSRKQSRKQKRKQTRRRRYSRRA